MGAREALPKEVKYYCVGRISVVRSRQGALCKRNISDWKRPREKREVPSLWLCFVRLHIHTGFIAASGVEPYFPHSPCGDHAHVPCCV